MARLIWLVLATGACVARSQTNAVTKTQLKADMISGYGLRSIRPLEKQADLAAASGTCATSPIPPEQVETQLYVDQYVPLDVSGQTYGFSGYLRVWWNDPQLTYNSTSAGGCTDQLSFTPEESANFWSPRFYWEDAKSIEYPAPSDGELFMVYPNGDIWWSRQVAFLLNCPFSKGALLDRLPFDTQTCGFKMGMYAETASEVVLKWKPGRDPLANWQGVCMAEWGTTRITPEDMVDVYTSANYTYAHFALDFSRYPSTWIWSFMMPAIVTVMLSYLGFYIDPAATPARVALGMLCLLFNVNNFSAMLQALPPTAQPPWLTRFVLNSFFFNLVAMVEQIVVSFGSSAQKWLEAQRKDLEVYVPWKSALRSQSAVLKQLLVEWDKDNSGTISKKEFRRGVQAVGVRAPLHQINSLFDKIDDDEDGQVTPTELEKGLADVGLLRATVNTSEGGQTAMQEYESKLVENMNLEGNGDVSMDQVDSEIQARPMPAIEAKATSNKVNPMEAMLRTVATTSATKDTVPSRAKVTKVAATKPLEQNATAMLHRRYLSTARADLDKDWLWEFKTFRLFPLLSRLRNLDHACRWLYPLGYFFFIFLALGEIGFGTSHEETLMTSECYRRAIGK